jgi:NAD(P)-dependent dehydrogenase (short-subunit alcohol dehydrogenase family)
MLDGRIAIVTGAAHGNGAAIARLLAAEGAGVASFDIDGAGAAAEAQRIAEATGARVFGERADVSSAADVQAAVARTLNTFGRIDILVNNAGILLDTPLPGLDMARWDKTLAINLTGPVRFIDAVAPAMIAQGEGGSIVNITSIGASLGFAPYVAYCAAKSGLMGVTRAAALALAPHRIRVNAVAPGIIHTEMTKPLYADPAALAEITSKIPLGYVGDAVEVAKVVLYLASDLSTYVTASEHMVDAGYAAQ